MYPTLVIVAIQEAEVWQKRVESSEEHPDGFPAESNDVAQGYILPWVSLDLLRMIDKIFQEDIMLLVGLGRPTLPRVSTVCRALIL